MGKILKGAKSLFTIAKNAATGVDQTAPIEVSNARLDICLKCTELNKMRQCSQCLCFVDFKTKISHEQCPLSKWLKHDLDIKETN